MGEMKEVYHSINQLVSKQNNIHQLLAIRSSKSLHIIYGEVRPMIVAWKLWSIHGTIHNRWKAQKWIKTVSRQPVSDMSGKIDSEKQDWYIWNRIYESITLIGDDGV